MATTFNGGDNEYHGNYPPQGGYMVEDWGSLDTDRFLLQTCTAVFIARRTSWANIPDVNSAHPVFSYIAMEHRQLKFDGPWARATCSYAGVQKDTTPVYELCGGLGEEPIETHPKFAEKIGGTPKSPRNFATFRNTKTGAIANTANPADDNAGYVFAGFEIFEGITDTPNPLAGIVSYLASDQITWKYTQNLVGYTYKLNELGKISTPIGNAPTLPQGGNWLDMGINATQRGAAVQIVKEWRASGRRGWSELIYGT